MIVQKTVLPHWPAHAHARTTSDTIVEAQFAEMFRAPSVLLLAHLCFRVLRLCNNLAKMKYDLRAKSSPLSAY